MIKKSITALLVLTISVAGAVTAFADAPAVSAQAVIVTELTSGRVLYSKNAEARLPMASTTKIMTALVALEEKENEIDRVFEISAAAAGVEGSSMYLEKGEKMTLRELLYGLMLSSGNDAAVAVSEAVAESTDAFVGLMNDKAREIGLMNTSFENPNGLPDENHYSSAADMARLTEAAMKNEVFAQIVGTKSYTVSGDGKAYPRTLTNHNKLLSMYDGCIGVKTGFTKAAGRCLVSAAKRDGMTLICVTLNAPSDWSDHSALYDYVFENYKLTELTERDLPVAVIEAENSYEGAIPVYVDENVFFPLKEGEEVCYRTEIDKCVFAPLSKGEKVGRIIFEYGADRKEIAEADLVVRSDVQAVSITDSIGRMLAERLKNIFSRWIGQLK